MKKSLSMKEKAIILLSGGMDSLVSAVIALRVHIPYFLHVNYGQRTEKKELEVFNRITEYYKADNRLIVDMKHFKQIGGSALTDDRIDVPKGLNYQGIPVTYVPFRNANLLSIAVSWAEVVEATSIYIGATQEDSAGYPDCRKEFYQVFNDLIRTGTQKKNIQVITPIIDMKKSEIVRVGIRLNAPFNLTWSCYEREDIPCGECDSCLRRAKAFAEASILDPLV